MKLLEGLQVIRLSEGMNFLYPYPMTLEEGLNINEDDLYNRNRAMLRTYSRTPEILPFATSPGRKYIRFGKPPKSGKSRMHNAPNVFAAMYGERELRGVSVFPVTYDREHNRWSFISDELADSGFASLDALLAQVEYHQRGMYLVTGEDTGEEGTDGEPLLRNVKILDTLSLHDVHHEGYYHPEESAPHHPGEGYSKYAYVPYTEWDKRKMTIYTSHENDLKMPNDRFNIKHVKLS